MIRLARWPSATTKASRKKKTASTKVSVKTPLIATAPETEASAPAVLRQFVNGGGDHANFDFTRYWWEGSGPRAGIAPWVEKKIRPGDDPNHGAARHVDLVLLRRAPGDYWDIFHLLARFDASLPAFERHAFVQVKIGLPDTEPLHVGAEKVRSFARRHFATERRLAAILVTHAPGVAGSSNTPHVHVVVPARELGPNGFGVTVHRLCSDSGQQEAWEAWKPYVDQWDGETP